MLLDCLLESLPLILAAIGILLLGFIIAAVIVVAIGWTGGTAAAFAAAVVAVLAGWWVPITLSIVTSLMLAVSLCMGQDVAPPVAAPAVGQPLMVSTAITGLTVITLTIAIYRRRKKQP